MAKGKNKKSIARWTETIFEKLKDGSINIGDKELTNIPKVLLPPEVIVKQPTNAQIMTTMNGIIATNAQIMTTMNGIIATLAIIQKSIVVIQKDIVVIQKDIADIKKDVSYLKTFHPPMPDDFEQEN